jgi:DNA polymerase-1|tara:strand:- start:1530 stop:2549 length:1020 start_codon:yes stop_codon:yes gene_type:complete
VSNKKYLSIFEEIKKKGGSLDDGQPNDKVLIIDGLNTFIRVFSVIPTTNDDGIHVGGIVGFLRSIGYTINMVRPTRTIIVFDGKGGSNRRRKLFPEYKQNRKTKYRVNRTYDFASQEDEKQNMMMQLSRCVEYLDTLPVTVMSYDNIEADDTIGYLCRQVLTESKITVMSTDKDFLQLTDDRIKIWSPTKKKMYNQDMVMDEYGINSHNYIWYRVLDGDKSDNIPGIRGLGLKTIQKKLPFLTENRIVEIDEVVDVLPDSKDIIELNYKLMQLSNVDISGSTKTKIIDKANEPINRLIKFKFQKMFLEDKLYTALPNITSWLATNFNQLNHYAEKTHDK